jgi:hypothetical protein
MNSAPSDPHGIHQRSYSTPGSWSTYAGAKPWLHSSGAYSSNRGQAGFADDVGADDEQASG